MPQVFPLGPSRPGCTRRSRFFRLLALLVAGLGLALAIGPGAAGPGDSATTVLEVRGAPEALARVLGGPVSAGTRIRLVGNGFALIEARTEAVSAILELPGSRVLGSFDSPPALFQLMESTLTAASRAALEP